MSRQKKSLKNPPGGKISLPSISADARRPKDTERTGSLARNQQRGEPFGPLGRGASGFGQIQVEPAGAGRGIAGRLLLTGGREGREPVRGFGLPGRESQTVAVVGLQDRIASCIK